MRFLSTQPLVARRSLSEWGKIFLLLVGLVLCLPAWAEPEESHPLRPPDTLSPRDILNSFLQSGFARGCYLEDAMISSCWQEISCPYSHTAMRTL